jgi:hypothetical protein
MNPLKGELEYGSISLDDKEDYRLYRYSDAGMGETEYRIFRNGAFFATFDNRKDAEEVMTVMTHKSERETVLDELKRDLKTRFVSSDSQWGRGRNSGLLECCNIIDEYLRQAGEP